jgi:hypothetical protein
VSRTFHLIMYAMLIGYAAFMTWMTDEYEGIVDQQQDTLEAVLYSQGCLQPVQPDEA